MVGVLGGGAWGTTLAHLLAEAGADALLWMRDGAVAEELNGIHRNSKYLKEVDISARVRATTDLADVTAACPLILVAVPLAGFREVAYRLGETLGGDQVVVSCAKGIEAKTRRRPSEILKEETCAKKVGALSGPNLSGEILEGRPCATVVASRFPEVVRAVTDALMSRRLRVYGSDDLTGVELAGALKNIYAIAAGIAEGLGYGANAKAALLTRGLWEMAGYAVKLGASFETITGLAGIGDLMASAESPLSRNNQVGRRLAAGESPEAIRGSTVHAIEGVSTSRVAIGHAREIACDMPIAAAVHAVLHEGREPAQALGALLGRPPRFEHAGLGA